MESLKFCLVCCIALNLSMSLFVTSLPVLDSVNVSVTNGSSEEIIENDNVTSLNGTHKDLYVIKAVVYEIGILTEVADGDNATEDEDFSRERVDLTFFDAHSNASHFNLGDIPLPVQTNVSGQVLTGIAPVHIGAIQEATDILSSLPLTGTIVNISHSDTSFINLSHSPKINENGTILDAEDLAKLPGINEQTILIDNTPQESDDDDDDEDDDDERNPNSL
ncbi:uncharacterized protein LOC119080781 [Bradysia coprophila]|uniref:uncharacterized protein LOC119080781 n=1 Tax=Bradysia coprophila TaxID=38358 RepID=UPI00187DBAF8|nr:uncharacterized protein LOC119080781 [Bradysia coprophila]